MVNYKSGNCWAAHYFNTGTSACCAHHDTSCSFGDNWILLRRKLALYTRWNISPILEFYTSIILIDNIWKEKINGDWTKCSVCKIQYLQSYQPLVFFLC